MPHPCSRNLITQIKKSGCDQSSALIALSPAGPSRVFSSLIVHHRFFEDFLSRVFSRSFWPLGQSPVKILKDCFRIFNHITHNLAEVRVVSNAISIKSTCHISIMILTCIPLMELSSVGEAIEPDFNKNDFVIVIFEKKKFF